MNDFIDSLKSSVEDEIAFQSTYREFEHCTLEDDFDINAAADSTRAVDSWLVSQLGLSVVIKLREIVQCTTVITAKLVKQLVKTLDLKEQDESMVNKVSYCESLRKFIFLGFHDHILVKCPLLLKVNQRKVAFLLFL